MLTWPFQTDAAVLRKVRAGDHASFRVIVDRYVHVIRGVALAYLSNPHDADDVVQDTFLRAFEAREKLTPPMNLGAWLVTVAKNRCFDLLRKRTRESGAAATAEPSIAPAFERDELYQVLWEQVSKLEPDMREVLMLYYFSRKNTRDIASLLNITSSAAAKRLQRARTTLGERIVDQIGNELSVTTDRKRDMDRVMGVLGAQIPGFAPSTNAVSLISGMGALKAATIVAAGLIVAAAFQYARHTGESAQPPSATAQTQAPIKAKGLKVANSKPAEAEQSALAETASKLSSESPLATPSVTGRIFGIVADINGRPIAGAKVSLEHGIWEKQFKNAGMGIGPTGQSSGYSRTATTDDDGTFHFDDFPLLGASKGYFGAYMLTASKGNLLGMSKADDFPWLFDQLIEITMYERYSIAGTVRDETVSPVPNVTVMPSCKDYGVSIGYVIWGGLDYAKTDEAGRFTATNLIRGTYELGVVAPGFKKFISHVVSVGSENVEIVLTRNGHLNLAGRVIDASGNGVEGVPVSAKPNVFDDENPFYGGGAISAADGSFLMQNLPAGAYTVGLQIESEFAQIGSRVPLEISQYDEPATVEIVVARGATISGHAQVTGKHRFGVTAKGKSAKGEPAYTRIEEDGTYKIQGLPADSYTIGIKDYPSVASQEIDVEIGKDYRNVNFEINPIWKVIGAVVDDSGKAIEGACVVALTEREISTGTDAWGWSAGLSRAVSDAHGNFSLDRYDDAPVQIQAIANDMVSSVTDQISPRGNQPIKLTMTSFGSIDGHVKPSVEHGTAQAILMAIPMNATKTVLFSDPNSPNGYINKDDLDPQMKAAIKTRSSFSGRFRFPCLPAGEYEIHAFVAGMTLEPNTQPTKIFVDAKSSIHDLEITLPMTGGGVVQGTLTMKGEPLVGQKVEIQRDFDAKTLGSWETWTDESGDFRIEGIQPGRHELNAVRYMSGQGENGLRELEHHFDISEGDVLRFNFDMASGTSRLSGVVTVDNVPMAGLTLFIRKDGPANSSPEALRAETDSSGRFTVDGIDPGIYDVQAILYDRQDRPGNTFSQSFRIEVLQQPENDVKLEVTAGGLIGKLAGVRPGETAIVALLPGVIDAGEMSLERMQELKEKIAYQDRAEPNGSYDVMFVERGTYTAFAVAYPDNSEDDNALFEKLRFQAEVVEIPAGKSLVMDFTLE